MSFGKGGIFVSSFTSETGCMKGSPLHDLRRWLHERGKSMKVPVWVAEQARNDLHGQDALEIVDVLIEEVRQCGEFWCILAGKRRGMMEHGTPIVTDGVTTRVSHFEIELYQAALCAKPVRIFVMEGFDPGPRLKSVLDLLKFAFPKEAWQGPFGVEQMCEIMSKCMESMTPSAARPNGRMAKAGEAMRQMVWHLYRERDHEINPQAGELQFLGEFREEGNAVDGARLDQAAWLLERVALAPDTEKSLARLWLVMRELSSGGRDQPDALPLLNRAMELWYRQASWYGLHGHLYLGNLAAIGTCAKVRRTMRELGVRPLQGDGVFHPHAAFASAFYSIAKRLPVWKARKRLMDRSLDEATQAIELRCGDPHELHNLRGNILLKQGKVSSAIAELERAVADVEFTPENGHFLTDLGFAEFRQGYWLRGCRHLEEGIALLHKGPASGQKIRALKKLGVTYLLCGRWVRASRILREAREQAHELRMWDQWAG